MNKTVALLVAALLIAGSFQAITDCLVEANSKCYLCKNGMNAKSDWTACETPTADCAHSSAATHAGLNFCELCKAGKVAKWDGTCVTANTTAPDAACGWPVYSGTAWVCFGCVTTASAAYTQIDPATAKCVTTALTTDAVTEITLTGTWKTCGIGYKHDAGATTQCSKQGGTNAKHADATTAPTSADLQSYDTTNNAANGEVWYYSSDKTITITTGVPITAISGCWIAHDATNCARCRPTATALTTIAPLAAAPWWKVTCGTFTAPTGTAKACRLQWRNGTAGTADLCQTCVDVNGTHSAPDANYSCAAAANNSSGNNSSATNASILSLSFAAIIMFIINRLF